MNSADWTLRSEIDYLEITIDDIDEITQQEQSAERLATLRLRWNPLGSADRLTDIGSYCYGERKGTGGNIWIRENTLIEHPHLPKIINGGLRRIRLVRRPLSGVTIGHLAKLLFKDKDFELSSARKIFIAFIAMLRTFHELGKYSNGALVAIELSGLEILTSGFGLEEEEVCRGVRRLRLNTSETKDKPVLDTESGMLIANAAGDHFLEISKSIISGAPLPWRITVAGKPILVTASFYMSKGLPRYFFLDDKGRPPRDSIYDDNCQLEKRRSIRNLPGRDPEYVRETTNAYSLMMNEKKRLRSANKSKDSLTRKRLISEALLSFCIYTYFDTGANATSLQGRMIKGVQVDAINVQDICDESGAVALDIDRGSKCYVLETYKARARNKPIDIYFSSTWVKRILPTYLRLREHICELGVDVPDNLLFLLASPQYGQFRVEKYPRIGSRLVANPGHLLNVFLSDCGLDRISVGMIRNYKSVSISREAGVKTSSRILGHDLQTALKKYNRIKEAEAQLQIAGLINDLHKIAVEVNDNLDGRRLEQGGLCKRSEQDAPVGVESEELGDFAPNCRTRTGCWLCPDFAVHADEEDLWKLASYLHILSELRQNSDEPQIVGLVHEPVVRRLSALIERISNISRNLSEIASKVHRKIEADQLHPTYEDLRQVYARVGFL